MCVEKIKVFSSSITKGPFRRLNEYLEECDGHCSSAKIVGCQDDYGSIFDCAVHQAYLDMCRTVSGAGEGALKESVRQAKEEASRCLKEYFEGDPKTEASDFDDWMKEALRTVSEPAEFTVGQSQKIINMAFKYLFCCYDLREKDEGNYFSKCHMPLDDYTLAWYKRECDPDWKTKWSKINDIDDYLYIQCNIRKERGGENVLVSEFDIWSAEKYKRELYELKRAVKRVRDNALCDLQLEAMLTCLSENYLMNCLESLSEDKLGAQ